MAQREGYFGDSLTALVNEGVRSATDGLMRDIASQARDVLFTTARAATPARTGIVRDSWLAKPIRREGDVYSTGVENGHWLAWLLDVGAQPHDIFPEHGRALETPQGPRADVHSPGFRGHHMAQRAVETTEAVLPEVTYAARERWKRECEFAIERSKIERRVI